MEILIALVLTLLILSLIISYLLKRSLPRRFEQKNTSTFIPKLTSTLDPTEKEITSENSVELADRSRSTSLEQQTNETTFVQRGQTMVSKLDQELAISEELPVIQEVDETPRVTSQAAASTQQLIDQPDIINSEPPANTISQSPRHGDALSHEISAVQENEIDESHFKERSEETSSISDNNLEVTSSNIIEQDCPQRTIESEQIYESNQEIEGAFEGLSAKEISELTLERINPESKEQEIGAEAAHPQNKEGFEKSTSIVKEPVGNSESGQKISPISTDPIVSDVESVEVEETSVSPKTQSGTDMESKETDTFPPMKKRSSPRKYIPPIRVPLTPSHGSSSVRNYGTSENTDEQKLPIAVRVYFQRGDSIQVSLLLGRRPDLPDLIDTAWSGQEINLFSLTDDWFEGISPAALGLLLERGIEWATKPNKGKLLRWSLSGRSLYVLGSHNALSGFISTTRLVLGEMHVVLCRQEVLESALDVIAQTGSPPPNIYEPDSGLPDGWYCLRNVLPVKPILQTDGQDILNILRPLPDLDIVLKNGIRIGKFTWLSGYPPKILLHGDLSIVDRVLLDRAEVTANENGEFTAPGWNSPGNHTIWAAGQSKSYSIQEVTGGWDIWEAYKFTYTLFNRNRLNNYQRSICGPLVTSLETTNTFYPVIVPATNPVMIGAIPGQVFTLQSKLGEKAPIYGDFSAFPPVWALPSNPYQVDKRRARILYVGEQQFPRRINNLLRLNQLEIDTIRKWANMILAASRKGLLVEPLNPATKALWQKYKQQAKAIWRKLR